MNAQRFANEALRLHPIPVRTTPEGSRVLRPRWQGDICIPRELRGKLVGISNQSLKVRIEGRKTVGYFHEKLWRKA